MARDKLRLTIDPRFTGIARDSNGLGWRAFGGGATLVCRGCGKEMTRGFVDCLGHDRRCEACVVGVRWGEAGDGE